MTLQALWSKYQNDTVFNLSSLPEEIRKQGREVRFAPREIIVSRGETLKYVYFLKSGKAIGQREYANGKEYTYFRVTSKGGNIGLLELLSRNETLVASIIALTEVTAVRLDASLILEMIMTDMHILRRCLTLIARDFYRESDREGRYYYVEGIDRIRYYLIERYDQLRMEEELSRAGTGRKVPEKICIDVQYQEIANSTGISVRTVGRCLKKLRENGEIQSIRQKIMLGKKELELLGESLQNSEL